MLQCKDVVEEASNYIDGDLPLFKRIGLFLHVVLCRCCRNYVNQIRQTIDTVAITKPKEPDDTDIEALAKTLHKAYVKTHPK